MSDTAGSQPLKYRNSVLICCFSPTVIAGLSNAMFMPPGSLVVEMTNRIDSVNMPVCGYIGVFGAIFGHHHYLYTYTTEQGDVLDDSRSSEISRLVYAFYSQLRMKRVVEAGVDRIL